jgi:pimeloyl-ACP methyl ester carboxylesterase
VACTALLGDRVTRTGLVATTTRFLLRERPGAIEERRAFELVEQSDRKSAAQTFAAHLAEWTRTVAHDPPRFFDSLPLNDQNRWWREDPSRAGPFLRAIAEALASGVGRPRVGTPVVSFERFPVSLENISVDVEVLLWHGELDMVAPCVPARLLGSRIPNCNVTI